MLMLGIISEIYGQSSHLSPGISYFFCQAQEHENNATDALRSMMWLLLIQQPHLLSYLTETHKRSGEALFNGSNAFFFLSKTFLKMLEDDNLSQVYLAFDALDECAPGKPGVQDLVYLVRDSLNITGKSAGKIKWIVSSRPEIEVHQRLGHKNSSALIELNVQDQTKPVNVYIAYKLCEIKETLGYTQDILDELETEVHKRAQNTYLWAALVFRIIIENRMGRRAALKEVQDSPKDLSDLYDRMMTHIDQQDEENRGFCKDLLAAVCFASRPLSYAEVHVLAGLPYNVDSDEIVRICGSFLVVRNETVYMLHNTSHEHLRKYFASRKDEVHFNMFSRSIAAMSKGLRYNIYNLHPGSESTDIKPTRDGTLASLQYSCEFWVDHLRERSEPLADDGTVLAFLEVHFLHWLESLSLIHKVPTALPSIRDLLSKAKSLSECPKLVAFLQDAERFTMRNLTMMMQAPLQLYSSALSFSPSNSVVRTKFWEQRSVIEEITFIGSALNLGNNWDTCIQTLYAGKRVSKIVFSPNGKLFATASEIVCIWDAATGIRLQEFQIDGRCNAHIAFSADSETLTLALADKVQVMDVITGACQEAINLGFPIEFMACSPDGKMVAFAADTMVKIFDASTWTLKHTLKEHTQSVVSIDFSPDSRRLASASNDQSVRLWDISKGTCQEVFEIGGLASAVYLLPDNKSIGVLYPEIDTEDRRQENCFFTSKIESIDWKRSDDKLSPTLVAIAPDGKTIALVSDSNHFVGLLDVETEDLKNALIHGDLPDCMVFSNDSETLVSGSSDGVTKIWDVTRPAEMPEEDPDGHEGEVTCSKVSSKGNLLATGSTSGAVKLWDTVGRELQHTLEEFADVITHLALSPDGNFVAAASSPLMYVWDLTNDLSATPIWPVNNTTESELSAVEFSPDGTEIAISTERGTTHLWDIGTATYKQDFELKGYDDSICQFSFSQDGKTLATCAKSHGAQVWDLATRTCKATLVDRKEDNEAVICIALSPDGKTLVSSTSRRVVQVWDVVLGVCKQTIPTDIEVKELSFADDGKYLNASYCSFSFTSGVLAETPTPKQSGSALYINESWIMKDGQRLLQTPSEYSPEVAVPFQNTVVLGGLSGQIVFLDFADC